MARVSPVPPSPRQIMSTVSSSNASIAARIAPGSASTVFTPYRRQTLRMARSRSPAAFSTPWRSPGRPEPALRFRLEAFRAARGIH